MQRFVLLLSCFDKPGIIAEVASLVRTFAGNIIDLDQHVDKDDQQFFMRVAWDASGASVPQQQGLELALEGLMQSLGAVWHLFKPRAHPISLAIFASKTSHCLVDLLWRAQMKELPCKIVGVVSNHPDLQTFANQYGVPFAHVPVTPAGKADAEKTQGHLLQEWGAECLVLARYMQVLSASGIERFAMSIINIHHSFLPAFAGGHPYEQARQKGVKLIGATSHYVTPELDQGPIIQQDVTRISHKDSLSDIVMKGRDLERVVLARALRLHLDHRVLVHQGRTIVFD